MDAVRERLREVLRRAGMSHVPPPVLVAVVAIAVAAVLGALWHWWPRGNDAASFSASATSASAAAPTPLAGTSSPAAAASAKSGGASSDEQSATVYVHVVGAVRHPGLYALPAGARVADAVAKAGGLLGNAAERALNLARRVEDGEQIVALTEDEYVADGAALSAGVASGGDSSGGAGQPSAPININTADAALLDTLPGVGPSTAEKIVADREANGHFATVDDLARVTGIGPKKLDALRDLIVAR